jgi:hypothetical protein
MTPSDQPFRQPLRPRWIPPEMINAPILDHDAAASPIQPRYALLINPFYPERSPRQFRQARPDADARPDQLRRHDPRIVAN